MTERTKNWLYAAFVCLIIVGILSAVIWSITVLFGVTVKVAIAGVILVSAVFIPLFVIDGCY